jgi:hypothetical protein
MAPTIFAKEHVNPPSQISVSDNMVVAAPSDVSAPPPPAGSDNRVTSGLTQQSIAEPTRRVSFFLPYDSIGKDGILRPSSPPPSEKPRDALLGSLKNRLQGASKEVFARKRSLEELCESGGLSEYMDQDERDYLGPIIKDLVSPQTLVKAWDPFAIKDGKYLRWDTPPLSSGRSPPIPPMIHLSQER